MTDDLSADGRAGLRSARWVAASFIVASALVPAGLWFYQARPAAPLLRPSFLLPAGALAVGLLLAFGLAARGWIDRRSVLAGSPEGFASLRLLVVVIPFAAAEVAAFLGWFVIMASGLQSWSFALLVPSAVVFYAAWPRRAPEVLAERWFLARPDHQTSAPRP